jgi:hypothetical protein
VNRRVAVTESDLNLIKPGGDSHSYPIRDSFSIVTFKQIIQTLHNLPRTIRIALVALLVVVVLVLVYPFKTVVVPAWPLRVIDNSNRPIAGINVTEHWQHYLLEDEGHEVLQRSDEFGAVSFPERSIRASLLRRGYRMLTKIGREGFRGRWDRYGSVVVRGSREHATTTAVHVPETVPQNSIVVPRLSY